MYFSNVLQDYCSTVLPDMAEERNLDVGVGEKKSKCAKTSSSEGEGDGMINIC